MKIQKKMWGVGLGAGVFGFRGGGGQGGCKRIIEVFVKIHKIKSGGGDRWVFGFWGVRVGVSGWMCTKN